MNNIVIHKKLKISPTGWPPSGFGDFIRGTISLYKLSRLFGFKLVVDLSDHPCSNFLQLNTNNIIGTINDTKEIYNIDELTLTNFLMKEFEIKDIVVLETNCSYNDYNDLNHSIDSDCIEFLKKYFSANDIVNKNVIKKMQELELNNKEFTTIHIRSGDRYMMEKNSKYEKYLNCNAPIRDENIYNIAQKIEPCKDSFKNTKVVLLTDNQYISSILGSYFGFKTTQTKPIHFGLLSQDTSELLDTFVDYFLMTRSNKIISIKSDNLSGFSYLCSKIYKIEYIIIF